MVIPPAMIKLLIFLVVVPGRPFRISITLTGNDLQKFKFLVFLPRRLITRVYGEHLYGWRKVAVRIKTGALLSFSKLIGATVSKKCKRKMCLLHKVVGSSPADGSLILEVG